ncbi:N-acetylmuramoyl-L-alanine amidase AmiC [Dyadobacter sp. CECT 9623]|jgi:N-acetylmuramoyl-L-alanine amidase|uniref:N-acetylmuramoyl-L-alanine amidase n=1 Tax=Dyadobacter linearis TaxID=2823330 RepID=A0ABN7RIF2_9BACT|nr:N-acetylmuramoyl-L-alanine amidase [Dyadobacter sp. CECT 9623]CAG5074333.1 N-acetylmuramoyl-L-alanine amidase AmiC [Dyadobacter sp. CECT 9623]
MLKVLKSIIAASFLLASLAFVFQQEPADSKSAKVRTVVIDAGHGGKDPGTRGRKIKEKDVALSVALELGRKIKEATPEVKVLYTRSTDVFIELGERSAFANRNNADLFISIHCNATPRSRSVHGTETFVMGLHKTEGNLEVARRENSVILQETNYKQKYKGFDPNSPLAHIMLANYQSAFISSSLRLADLIEKKFQSVSDRESRGVKQAGFLVLWRCAMPSVLIETGFLSTPDEEDYLASEDGQVEVAESIHQAFMAYKKDMDR